MFSIPLVLKCNERQLEQRLDRPSMRSECSGDHHLLSLSSGAVNVAMAASWSHKCIAEVVFLFRTPSGRSHSRWSAAVCESELIEVTTAQGGSLPHCHFNIWITQRQVRISLLWKLEMALWKIFVHLNWTWTQIFCSFTRMPARLYHIPATNRRGWRPTHGNTLIFSNRCVTG